jgi:hypothetical protein
MVVGTDIGQLLQQRREIVEQIHNLETARDEA